MRPDMARVIVERPRWPGYAAKGRRQALEDLPHHEGIGRPYLKGYGKSLNENLAPLRRYLERQVGRPWNKIYSEIAKHLRVSSTVQQHVRNHLADFVAVKPRRVNGTVYSYPELQKRRFERLWQQPFYVDERDGILKRTDRLRAKEARRRNGR